MVNYQDQTKIVLHHSQVKSSIREFTKALAFWCGRVYLTTPIHYYTSFFTFQALETVNNSKSICEKAAKELKEKHTIQKDQMMKTVEDLMNISLNEKIQEVDKVYNPAGEKLSAQAEKIKSYIKKAEKSLQLTNDVLESSKLKELLSAQKAINEDIQVLQNEKPQDLTTFQVELENTESCMKTLCLHTMFLEGAVNCKQHMSVFFF